MRGVGIRRFGLAPSVGGVLGLTYAQKVLAIDPASLITYYPLTELAGVTADNLEGTAARDGTYTGATLADALFLNGDPMPRFDGANDFVDIYSLSLDGVFNSGEGTFGAWAQVFNAGVWTDGAFRNVAEIGVNATNRIILQKSSVNNTFSWTHASTAGGALTRTAIFSGTGLFHVALTWSVIADEVRAYLNGIQQGATINGVAAFAVGGLAVTGCVLGARSTVPNNPWNGWMSNAGTIWTTPLTPAQILSLATV